jgi:hypothetical protein
LGTYIKNIGPVYTCKRYSTITTNINPNLKLDIVFCHPITNFIPKTFPGFSAVIGKLQRVVKAIAVPVVTLAK